jgi:pSer/pThr/pTyr-binding forkhead associated (FHA) protein
VLGGHRSERSPRFGHLLRLGSRNGTRLNGKRIESATALADRDQVMIGRVVFTVRTLWGAASTKSEIQE